jgi:hypothetical protein
MKRNILAVLFRMQNALPASPSVGEVVRKMETLAVAINNKLTST